MKHLTYQECKMADLITYVPSIDAMKEEGALLSTQTVENDFGEQVPHPLAKLFSVDGDGNLTFVATKIPVVYVSGDSSLCLVRGVDKDLIEQSQSIQVLGECIDNQYVFYTDESKDIYESVRDIMPRMVSDGNGGEYEFTPPYMIGKFS